MSNFSLAEPTQALQIAIVHQAKADLISGAAGRNWQRFTNAEEFFLGELFYEMYPKIDGKDFMAKVLLHATEVGRHCKEVKKAVHEKDYIFNANIVWESEKKPAKTSYSSGGRFKISHRNGCIYLKDYYLDQETKHKSAIAASRAAENIVIAERDELFNKLAEKMKEAK